MRRSGSGYSRASAREDDAVTTHDPERDTFEEPELEQPVDPFEPEAPAHDDPDPEAIVDALDADEEALVDEADPAPGRPAGYTPPS
jgi:hypothetical protein